MKTILIAQADEAYADRLTSDLRSAGFHVVNCSGPEPPRARCIRCDKGYCPLTEGADVLIYDPTLTALDDFGERHNLALESAQAHPDVPMLLAWPPGKGPEFGILRELKQHSPNIHAAAIQPDALVLEINKLLT